MRLEIDMPEHQYNNIMAIDSMSLGRAPYKGIIMYAINAIKHGRVLKQEPTTKNDLGVDAVSRQAVLELIADYDLSMGQVVRGIHALPSIIPQESRWIPVSKLPKAGEYIGDVARYYLVQNEYGDMMVASYDGIGWQQMYQHGYVEDKVVAWMPLPQKYREVEK